MKGADLEQKIIDAIESTICIQDVEEYIKYFRDVTVNDLIREVMDDNT